jgi:hypothetical protein
MPAPLTIQRLGSAGGRIRAVRPSLFMTSGGFRVLLAMLLTGAIWWLVSGVVMV